MRSLLSLHHVLDITVLLMKRRRHARLNKWFLSLWVWQILVERGTKYKVEPPHQKGWGYGRQLSYVKWCNDTWLCRHLRLQLMIKFVWSRVGLRLGFSQGKEFSPHSPHERKKNVCIIPCHYGLCFHPWLQYFCSFLFYNLQWMSKGWRTFILDSHFFSFFCLFVSDRTLEDELVSS